MELREDDNGGGEEGEEGEEVNAACRFERKKKEERS